MNHEFKKLDQLVQRNIPDASAPLSTLILPEKHLKWGKGFTLSACLVLIMAIIQNRQDSNQTESLIALEEVMSWDMTDEESVSEIEDVLELI